ncbi:hypothetical protein ACFZB9_19765 [Kitasatospora sp. NPDC008050]
MRIFEASSAKAVSRTKWSRFSMDPDGPAIHGEITATRMFKRPQEAITPS